MGAGTAVLAWDVPFNRDVAGARGRYFRDEAVLAELFDGVEASSHVALADGRALREIARMNYRWNDVALAYEALAVRLATGTDSRSSAGRRRYADPHPISAPTPALSPNLHEGSSH
jgi:hypothetical protein